MSDWEKVSTETKKTDETWKPEKEGDTIDGLYIDVRDINKKDGTQTKIYVLQKEDGTLVSIWDAAGLTRAMGNIEIGKKIKIEYGGKQQNPNTKRFFHKYDVYREKDSVKKEEPATEEVAPDEIPF